MFEQYRNLYNLEGKVALITGGGGIGSSVSKGLAALGAKVVITGMSTDRAAVAADEINSEGGSAEAHSLNVADVKNFEPFTADIAKRLGSVDILVNCVGTHKEAPAEQYLEEDWDHIFNVNVKEILEGEKQHTLF